MNTSQSVQSVVYRFINLEASDRTSRHKPILSTLMMRSTRDLRLDLSVPAFVEYLEPLLLLMLGLRLTGYPPVWPLRTGASDLIGIVLTVILVLFVNSIIYLMKKVR